MYGFSFRVWLDNQGEERALIFNIEYFITPTGDMSPRVYFINSAASSIACVVKNSFFVWERPSSGAHDRERNRLVDL